MKGSTITGPVAKEAAELWSKVASNAGSVFWFDIFNRINLRSFNYVIFYIIKLKKNQKTALIFRVFPVSHRVKI
jgi:hypothetical protein